MKLYLVRHGESECNVQRRLYGRTDCSLTEKGCRQAREVGEKLAGEHIDLCISSPLIRAAETARLALAGRSVRIELDDGLMEQDMGEFENRPFEQMIAEPAESDAPAESAEPVESDAPAESEEPAGSEAPEQDASGEGE